MRTLFLRRSRNPDEKSDMMEQSGIDALRAAPSLLTLGGIAAAFGMASCCAMPLLFYSLGFGTAWLGGIGLFAAVHNTLFLTIALIGLVGGAATLIWQRRQLRRGMIAVLVVGLLLGCVLLWAGLTYV
jgi:mercuric ion transport protein